jgi:4-hydroxymandelate oxidase
VLRPDDARRCVGAGAAAVWVSNHGGRQLDYAAAPADCLAAVADAVGGVAAALGARAVFLGRPALWALATGGTGGVEALVERLREELVEAMRLTGCATPGAVSADLIA